MRLNIKLNQADGTAYTTFEIMHSLKAAARQGALALFASYAIEPIIEMQIPGLEVNGMMRAALVIFAAFGGSIEEAFAYFRHKVAIDELAKKAAKAIQEGN